jgi:hypothetical protein
MTKNAKGIFETFDGKSRSESADLDKEFEDFVDFLALLVRCVCSFIEDGDPGTKIQANLFAVVRK